MEWKLFIYPCCLLIFIFILNFVDSVKDLIEKIIFTNILFEHFFLFDYFALLLADPLLFLMWQTILIRFFTFHHLWLRWFFLLYFCIFSDFFSLFSFFSTFDRGLDIFNLFAFFSRIDLILNLMRSLFCFYASSRLAGNFPESYFYLLLDVFGKILSILLTIELLKIKILILLQIPVDSSLGFKDTRYKYFSKREHDVKSLWHHLN